MFVGRHHRRSAGAVAVIGLMTGGIAPRDVPAEHALRAGNGGQASGRTVHRPVAYVVNARGGTVTPIATATNTASAGQDPTKVAGGAQQALPSAGQTQPSALPRSMPAGLR